MTTQRYRKVSIRMWGDAAFRALSGPTPNAQTLFLYLLTGPHTGPIPGLSMAREAGLADALGWDLEGFRKAFREVSQKPLAKADWKAGVVWLPNAVRHNPPQSPNVIKSWATAYDELPECDLKVQAFRELFSFVEGMGEGFRKAFRQAFAKVWPNQEQEQEQDRISAVVDLRTGARAAAPEPPPKRDDADESGVRPLEGVWAKRDGAETALSSAERPDPAVEISAGVWAAPTDETDELAALVRTGFAERYEKATGHPWNAYGAPGVLSLATWLRRTKESDKRATLDRLFENFFADAWVRSRGYPVEHLAKYAPKYLSPPTLRATRATGGFVEPAPAGSFRKTDLSRIFGAAE